MSEAELSAIKELLNTRISALETRFIDMKVSQDEKLARLESNQQAQSGKVDKVADKVDSLSINLSNLKGRFAVWVTLGGVAVGAIAAMIVQGFQK